MDNTIEENDSPEVSVRCEEDTFKILIATDIHLGFEEKNPIRGQDTFDTFEEILQIAANEEVDFILLGGDLFHHARPSPYCIFKCIELLRRYCLGDRPVEIELLSDPSLNFKNCSNPVINYEDPNVNICIPVFSIHGNHDDPIGQNQISAVNLLSATGLVNYFGNVNTYDDVEIYPILLKKGQTKLALYGLSHIKDERLGRLFLDKKVKMMTCKDFQEWFNLLVWHQNRATRGVKNFIPDDALPDFLDLVVWGHEHDCRIAPERRFNDVFISQPGSTVATSLTAGEAISKKVGILRINNKDFQIEQVELKTARPFIFAELVLKDLEEMIKESDNNLTPSELTMEIVTQKINSMIEEAKHLGRNQRVSEKPLIRLNVKYKHERQVFNTIRFGQHFVGKVANPEDMVKCQAIKEPIRKKDQSNFIVDDVEVLAERVEDIVTKHFNEHNVLKLFPVNSLNEAVKKYIDTDDNEAPTLVSNHFIQEILQSLNENLPEINELDDFVDNFKREQQNDADFVHKILNKSKQEKGHDQSTKDDANKRGIKNEMILIDDDDDDDNDIIILAGTSKKFPNRGRGSRRAGRFK